MRLRARTLSMYLRMQAAAERALRWRRGGGSGGRHRPETASGDAFPGGGSDDPPQYDPGSDSMRAWNWSQWSKTVSVDVAWMMAAEVTAEPLMPCSGQSACRLAVVPAFAMVTR